MYNKTQLFKDFLRFSFQHVQVSIHTHALFNGSGCGKGWGILLGPYGVNIPEEAALDNRW